MPPAAPLAIHEHPAGAAGADRPVVVLVHGSLDRSTSFARVVRRLDGYHTVTYDRRGYQGSREAGPPCATLDEHVADLLAVIDGRPSLVVGHSLGCVIALAAALRADGPGPIVAVAAYEPPMPWLGSWARRPRPSAAPSADKPARPAATGRPEEEEPGLAAERFFRRMVGDGAWERMPEAGRASRRADGPALVADLATVRRADAPFDAARLDVPAVFGRGTGSLPHHRDAVGWLTQHAVGSELVEIDGAGHGAHLTHPDAFARMVRSAADRVTRKAGTRP
jgi:pimeloyl-ACP methyl ester carboxylesterase